MVELGETIYFCAGSEKNIKLTTPDDIGDLQGAFAAGAALTEAGAWSIRI